MTQKISVTEHDISEEEAVFVKEYVLLLLKQYYEKPNAVNEIVARARLAYKIKKIISDIETGYDVDNATGVTLDKIGSLVGLKRTIPILNDDEEYRFYIKLKIVKNNASTVMVSDNGDSITDLIITAFDGFAVVTDNYDMTLTLRIDDSVPLERLETISSLELLPRPQGVNYKSIIRVDPDAEYFGFSNNPRARGFASKFDLAYNGATLLTKTRI